MIKVLISKRSNYPVPAKFIKKVVEEFLENEGVVSNVEVSISLVGSKTMSELVDKYLKQDNEAGESQDFGLEHSILTFPFEDPSSNRGLENSEEFVAFPRQPEGRLLLGDIVISYPAALKEALVEQKLIEEKIKELLIHGLLHLLGRHHDT